MQDCRHIIFVIGNLSSALSMISFMPPETVLPSLHLFAQLFDAKIHLTSNFLYVSKCWNMGEIGCSGEDDNCTRKEDIKDSLT